MPDSSEFEKHLSKKTTTKSLFKAFMGNHDLLGITKREMKYLIEEWIIKDDVREKVRGIKINRRYPEIIRTQRLYQYFEIIGHVGLIERMSFDNSSEFVFTGGEDGNIKCWNIREGMLVSAMYGHESTISDFCFSTDGKIMVSVDYTGKLNIWDLSSFNIIHSIYLSTEAIFCEFINTGNQSNYNIFIVLADGVVKTFEFSEKQILNEAENRFMYGESIKAICITDGGRFVICGGWWPFCLIYDTLNLKSVVVLENFRVQTLCAAKNCLKFAASSENNILTYTYYCEGNLNQGNFNKKKSGNGHWMKISTSIPEDYSVEWLCYLPNYILVASCTDEILRLYYNNNIWHSIPEHSGCIFSHPTENIFAVVGQKLSIFQIYNTCDEIPKFYFDQSETQVSVGIRNEETHVKCIFSKMVYNRLNDCQFSEDGLFFVTCDEQGLIETYSVYTKIEVPREQFFYRDLENNGNIADEITTQVFNLQRQPVNDWRRLQYKLSQSTISRSVEIENKAAITLDKDRLSEKKFKDLYLTVENILSLPEESLSTNESTLNMSEISDTVRSSEGTSMFESSDTSSSDLGVVLRRNSLKKSKKEKGNISARGILRSSKRIIIDTSDIESISSDLPSTKKLVSFSKKRRFLLMDSNDESEKDLILSDSESISISSDSLKQSKKINNVSNIKRRNTIESDSDVECMSSNKPMNNNRIRSLRSNVLEENDLSAPNKEFKLRRHNNEATENSTLRRHKNNNHDSMEETDGRILRKHARYLLDSSPTSYEKNMDKNKKLNNISQKLRKPQNILDSDISKRNKKIMNHIDPLPSVIDEEFTDLEIELANFSRKWIETCSIHEGTKIYLDYDEYKRFKELETRLKNTNNIVMSGFYKVRSIKMLEIRGIEYLSLNLSGQTINIYEHPRSNGIICTEDQFNSKIGNTVKIWDLNQFYTGNVSNANRMQIKINRVWILKSKIAVEYDPLGLEQIQKSRKLGPLFDMDGLNYNVINVKIKNNLYKSRNDFLCDLSVLASKIKDSNLKVLAEKVYFQYSG